jgi:hypothetical protein
VIVTELFLAAITYFRHHLGAEKESPIFSSRRKNNLFSAVNGRPPKIILSVAKKTHQK